MKDKKTNLFIVLSGIFLTNSLIAEIIGTKLFSLEALFGIAPIELFILGEGPLSFTLTAGVVLWPVVFITTDIINEYFGKEGVRKISILTAGFILYEFFVLWLVTKLPPSPVWLNNFPNLEISDSFNAIFIQGMGIIIGSLTAFLVGQFVDVATFQWLRKFTGARMIWLRATGSTLVSQFVDSFVVLLIAFYLFGNLSFITCIAIGIVNYIYKFTVAVVLTPFLYIAHGIIDTYLGKQESERIIEEAASSGFIK